jgi:peptide methionine sulfoxide reductase MsrA
MTDTTKVIALNGCFWGSQYSLRHIPGIKTSVGYAGGPDVDPPPNYYNLDSSGHAEAIRIEGVAEATLPEILEILMERSKNDPSPESHPRYRRAILCEDGLAAGRVQNLLEQMGDKTEVLISPPMIFYPAEERHQDYYLRTYGD